MRAVLAFSSLAVVGLLLSVGCDQNCPDGETSEPVQNQELGSNQYVCAASDSDLNSASPTPTATADASTGSDGGTVPSFGGSKDSGTVTPDATIADATAEAGSKCATLGINGDEVVIVRKSAEPAIVDTAAPDGLYSLAQASFYEADGGGTPDFTALRASLQVTGGSILTLATQVTEPSLDNTVTYTLAYVVGSIANACATQPGLFDPELPPVSSAEGADLSWDGDGLVLTLRLHPQGGDLDLTFIYQPQT